MHHSAISAFLEPHWLHKASNHPVISKLICHFCLQHSPSCKCFDPWDVKHLLSLLESWAPASCLTLLALATAKHCSDITLLCIDNQHLFLQHNARHYFSTYITTMDWHQDSVQHAVLGLSE